MFSNIIMYIKTSFQQLTTSVKLSKALLNQPRTCTGLPIHQSNFPLNEIEISLITVRANGCAWISSCLCTSTNHGPPTSQQTVEARKIWHIRNAIPISCNWVRGGTTMVQEMSSTQCNVIVKHCFCI